MKRRSISKVLNEVDPELTVISGGKRNRRRRKKAVKLTEVSIIELPTYTPRRSNEDDWNNADGVDCPVCGNKTLRLVPYGMMGKRQACLECRERRRSLMEYKQRVVAPRFRRR